MVEFAVVLIMGFYVAYSVVRGAIIRWQPHIRDRCVFITTGHRTVRKIIMLGVHMPYLDACRGSGTGVIIDANLILTNRHLLWGKSATVLVNKSRAHIVKKSKRRDLMLLSVATGPLPPVCISTNPDFSKPVFVIGNPAVKLGFESSGKIIRANSHYIYISLDKKLSEFECGGISGSGLYDPDGVLIGIIAGTVALKRHSRQRCFYAITGYQIKKFLDD